MFLSAFWSTAGHRFYIYGKKDGGGLGGITFCVELTLNEIIELMKGCRIYVIGKGLKK